MTTVAKTVPVLCRPRPRRDVCARGADPKSGHRACKSPALGHVPFCRAHHCPYCKGEKSSSKAHCGSGPCLEACSCTHPLLKPDLR